MKHWLPLALATALGTGCVSTDGNSNKTTELNKSDASQKASELVTRSKYTIASGGKLKPEHEAIVIKHADLSFKILPDDKAIEASASLTIKALQQREQIWLDLDYLLPVSSVKVNGMSLATSNYSNEQGQLKITLPTAVSKGEKVKVTIDYAGKPMVAKRAPWDGGFVWGKTENDKHWIATAVQGEGCDIFWPCIDHPLREPYAVDMHISVPEGLAAAANGKYMGKETNNGWNTYHWKTLKQINTYAIALNIGPYELIQDTYKSHFGNEIDLQYWHLEGQEEGAKGLFREFSEIMAFFEQMIGPYPFGDEKMGVVDTPHLGMEHQTINAYGNDYKVDRFGFDWLLHHEFAHEWFGNQLTHKDPDDMWLHEGFGSYMQPLYSQYLYGDAVYFEHLSRLRRGIKNKAPVVAGRPMTEQEVYVDGPASDIYNKGAVFLHTLRELIGDEAFFKATRKLVYGTDTPKPGNFKPLFRGTEHLIEIVNEVTGKDYTWLFKAYLYEKDLPKLMVNRTADKVQYQWQLAEGIAFEMPLEVSVNGKVTVLPMTDMKGELALNVGDTVITDPEAKVLRDMPFMEAFGKADRKERSEQYKKRKKMQERLAELEKLVGNEK